MLIEMNSQNPVNVIQAHKSEIEIMKFSQNGKLLASASTSGTIIRIFSIPDSKLKYSFRRGSSSAKIYDINFNKSSTMCCVGSENGTIHLFKLEEQDVSSFSTAFGDMFQSTRAFTIIKNVSSSKFNCTFSSDEKYVIVITFEGILLKFQINFTEGGECKLVEKNNLFKPKFHK
jgi:WD40 repeat protein